MPEQKRALVIRMGGTGDILWSLPVVRKLKDDGYYVCVHTSASGKNIFENEKCVDELVVHGYTNIQSYFGIEVPKGTLIVDLTAADDFIIEGKYRYGCIPHANAFCPGCPDCETFKQKRDERLRVFNHEDLVVKGWDVDGRQPTLEFTPEEIADAQATAERLGWAGKFVVIWCQSHSAEFKIFPHWFDVMSEFVAQHEDAVVYSVGAKECAYLQVAAERIIPITGEWSYRKSALMCTHAQLVVGVEGALLAGCAFDPVPKIMLMTCSHPNNVAKNWVNTTCLQPHVPCHPCHQLHISVASCPVTEIKREKPEMKAYWPICSGMGFSNKLVVHCMCQAYNGVLKQDMGVFVGV